MRTNARSANRASVRCRSDAGKEEAMRKTKFFDGFWSSWFELSIGAQTPKFIVGFFLHSRWPFSRICPGLTSLGAPPVSRASTSPKWVASLACGSQREYPKFVDSRRQCVELYILPCGQTNSQGLRGSAEKKSSIAEFDPARSERIAQ